MVKYECHQKQKSPTQRLSNRAGDRRTRKKETQMKTQIIYLLDHRYEEDMLPALVGFYDMDEIMERARDCGLNLTKINHEGKPCVIVKTRQEKDTLLDQVIPMCQAKSKKL